MTNCNKKEHWEAFKDPYGGIASFITSRQAIDISVEKYGGQKDGTQQNALQHALWNALMTVNIGYDRGKKFADAHEVQKGSIDIIETNEFSRTQNTEMDYYYNELGRQAALEFVKEYEKSIKYGKKIDNPIEELAEYVDNKIKEDLSKVLILIRN